MKKIIRQLYQKVLGDLVYRTQGVTEGVSAKLAGEQEVQLMLKNQYKTISKENIHRYSFDEIGFRKYSQNSEDGILLFIFALIGTINKTVVEICASDGIQCNAANLIINHGWQGLLFDGDKAAVERGIEFYRTHLDTFTLPPKFVHAWITLNNVNDLIKNNSIQGDIDLLSLDMDGVDYWIWDAIDCISPRVVVAEIQCVWGAGEAVTVPYTDDFHTKYINGFGVYSGASLNAFIKLAQKKNYRLVGFEKYGFNAFFIRNDVATDIFPAIDTKDFEEIPFVKWAKSEFFDLIKDKPWRQV